MKIMFGLLPLIVLSFFSVIFGNSFVGVNVSGYTFGEYTAGVSFFNVSSLTIALESLVAIALASALIGIQILGSGLADSSVRLLMTGAVYTALWVFLSLLAYPLIRTIEIFGVVLYVILTILYTIGVIEKMISE